MSSVLFAAVDVDASSFHVAVLCLYKGMVAEFRTAPNAKALASRLKDTAAGRPLQVCYESTYLGFSLKRELDSLGLPCDVIASSLIPSLVGKRLKNDRVDARKLASLYAKSLLTVVVPPDEQTEADRSLLRSRAFAVRQVTKTKNHVSQVIHTLGWDYRSETGKKGPWTAFYRDWLEKKVARAAGTVRTALVLMLQQLDHLERTVEAFNKAIEELAECERYKEKVNSLTAFRGINRTHAMTLVTEIGDIRRFPHPRKLVGYVGLSVIEYSSGGHERRFGIAKTGNRFVRTALIEACQFAFAPPRVSKELRLRRLGASADAVETADRAMARLAKKGTRLLFRGKPRNKVKVALARELLCFVWESLQKAA